MYLVTYQPETGIITSAGVINPAYALPPELLPEGSIYTEALPEGDLDGWLYQDGVFVSRPDIPAPLTAEGEESESTTTLVKKA